MSKRNPKQAQPSRTADRSQASEVGAGEDPNAMAQPTGGPPPADHEQIAIRAYEIWLSRGQPEGSDQEDWFEAERQLREQATGPTGVVSDPDRS
jgi:hypothetical protein